MTTDTVLDKERWQRMCWRFGIHAQPSIDMEFDRIVVAYGEPQRFYHTVQHINECLGLLDWLVEIQSMAPQPLLEMGLWYHDVVYRPQASDNERCSADQAIEFLRAGKCQQIEVIDSLIMATCHLEDYAGTAKTQLSQWMVDIDLAILGASPQRFTQYETQIRQEYVWVPQPLYRQKRQTVLMQFLNRPHIYQSPLFQQRFESQARRNLSGIAG
ncbi:MAG: hypothetical protein AAGA83_14495 [Cyanobacteria bacterium P01_F01_bin.116]